MKTERKNHQPVGAPLVGAHDATPKKGAHKRRPYGCILALVALISCTDGEPGPGASPADSQPLNSIHTRATIDGHGEIIAGTLTLALTDAPQQSATYTYNPATASWTATGTPLNVGTGTYTAQATAKVTFRYNSSGAGGSDGNEYELPIPMTWAGTIATTHTPGTAEARMESSITLVPTTAVLHVTLFGSYSEGQLPSDSYPDGAYDIKPETTIAYNPEAWTQDPFWLRWRYPAQPQSPQVFEPQTIAPGTHLFTILASDEAGPYANQEFYFHLPAGKGIELKAGERHYFNIRLDPGAGTATLINAWVEDFKDSGTDDPQFGTHPRGIYTERQLRQFATEWNALPYDDYDPDNAEHLEARRKVLARWGDGKNTIYLKADIQMSDEPFEPIGCPDNLITQRWFDAVFHGEGHTITGLKIETGGGTYAGLFGMIARGGKVYALHLRDAQIKAIDYAGGIAGYIYGGLIAGCSFGGEVSTGNGTAAGIVEGSDYSTIAGCYAGITAITGSLKGGIAGSAFSSSNLYGSHWKAPETLPADGSTDATVEHCYEITGTITPERIYQMNNALNTHAPDLYNEYEWQAAGADGFPILKIK